MRGKSNLTKLKKTDAKGTFTFRIDVALLEKLKADCETKGIVVGRLIEHLIEEYLKNK